MLEESNQVLASLLRQTEGDNIQSIQKLLAKHNSAALDPQGQHDLRKMQDEAINDNIATSRQHWLNQKGMPCSIEIDSNAGKIPVEVCQTTDEVKLVMQNMETISKRMTGQYAALTPD